MERNFAICFSFSVCAPLWHEEIRMNRCRIVMPEFHICPTYFIDAGALFSLQFIFFFLFLMILWTCPVEREEVYRQLNIWIFICGVVQTILFIWASLRQTIVGYFKKMFCPKISSSASLALTLTCKSESERTNKALQRYPTLVLILLFSITKSQGWALL